MKTEKNLPYVLEDEFRQPNDHLDWCLEFGEEYNSSDLYEWISFPNKLNKKYELFIIGNYLIENADEEYFIIMEVNEDNRVTKIARIKYTKPEYVHVPYDCGKEELILTQEEKQILNDFFKKKANYKGTVWKHFLWRTIDALEGFTETYLTEDIEQPNYLELPDERKD